MLKSIEFGNFGFTLNILQVLINMDKMASNSIATVSFLVEQLAFSSLVKFRNTLFIHKFHLTVSVFAFLPVLAGATHLPVSANFSLVVLGLLLFFGLFKSLLLLEGF